MLETAFTRLLSAEVPIQAAAMPGVTTVELVAAVADAGAVGMLPAPSRSAEELDAALGAVRSLASGVFGVNFLVPFLAEPCVDVAASGASLVEFFYGEPDPALVERVHSHGALASWQVGSLAEARAAEEAGCDLVVVQGIEAGGHVRGKQRLFPLLSEMRDALRIPLLAAGGLATGSDLADALRAGAAGVRMGTRFVATRESGAHATYVRALLGASSEDTCLTEAFSVLWPDAPHRVLRSAVEAAAALAEDPAGQMRLGDRQIPVLRHSALCPTVTTEGHIEAMALYAGESVSKVNGIAPAADIVESIERDAIAEIRR